ncbi:MAG: ISNCY family transposase, partial [Desulfobacterales bacterium]
MREKLQKQMPLMNPATEHDQAKELEAIDAILKKHPTICDLVYQDLCANRCVKTSSGARGMSAEQVLRAAIVKALFGFTYKELAFHLIDSRTLRRFCLIGFADKGFKKSVLNKNIKALSADTWEQVNRQLLGQAAAEKTEKAREVRIDCTVVETNIHAPTDSSLLFDAVRVLTRLLHAAKEACGSKGIGFKDHLRRAKRRMLAIEYARNERQRKSCYRDLLKVARSTLGYSRRAISWIDVHGIELELLAIAGQLRHYCDLTEKVISQTERRVIAGETVPAAEKIFSIFEPHTDIIIKDRRDEFYGHKICLTGGGSNLILDCLITDGNPADSTLTQAMLERQREIYGRYPLKAALDGGFASMNNLKDAKTSGVKDVCFAKKRGLEVADMCRSEYVYNRLRRFRAGIESGISWLKRSFGLWRCTWRGLRSFKSYVWCSIVAAN